MSYFAPPKYQEACWKTLISTPRFFLKLLLPSTLFCSLLPPGCPPCRNPKLSVGSWKWQLSHLRHCFKQQPAHLHSLRICFGATLSFRPIGNIMLRYLVGGLIDENLQPINLTSSWRLSILIWPLASCSNQFPLQLLWGNDGISKASWTEEISKYLKYGSNFVSSGPCKYSFLCSYFQLCSNPLSLRAQLAWYIFLILVKLT